MKKLILFLSSFLLTGTMMAHQLTPDEALALALGKMKAAQPERTRAQAASINAASVSLTHTEMSVQNVPLYYIYNIAEGGIIIAGADDRASSLLGYTDSGDFDGAKQNESFMAWLKDCRRALSHIDSMPEKTRSASAEPRALATSVQPLLGEIEWDLEAPYNLLTPMRVGYANEEAAPDTIHARTGCVATAVAQVMMYYQWPVTGTGSHTNMNDSTQTVDFSQSTYQWSKMLPAYKGDESEESKMAVAQLMYDVGCALDMEYRYDNSYAWNYDILKALANHFGYDKNMRLVFRTQCSTEEWNLLLMTELNEMRPVLFGAQAPLIGGHRFVIDGYDTNGLYHVNWGWSGRANGYFDMNLMDPDIMGIGGYAGGFTIGQDMVLGIKPDKEGTSVAKSDLVVYKQFNFDMQTQQWTYTISNYSLGDFTGEVGIAIESPTGEVAKLKTETFDAEPIGLYKMIDCSFSTPVASGSGYKLYPYYCDVTDGEMKRIPAPYNSYSTLYSVEEDGMYNWKVVLSEVADLDIVDVVVKHHFVGFDPLLNITLSNSAASIKEFADDICVEVSTMEDGEKKLVCSGLAQAFVMPGETKEIVVWCSQVEDQFVGKIVEGVYTYSIKMWIGGDYIDVDSASFEMVIIPPSDITYSDFAINKTEFLPNEELVASMTVANTGGFDMKTLELTIFRQSDFSLVDNIGLENSDIDVNSNETFTFKKAITFDPGEYIAVFFVDHKQLMEAPVFEITVGDPTSLDKIQSAPVNDAMSGIYDLQGRPVLQMRKSGLYIGKGKFLIK